jgi:peptide/nickel transport system substrate-binding protein
VEAAEAGARSSSEGGADSVTLDPINATDGESFRATRQILDTLLDFAPESFDLIPALAT